MSLTQKEKADRFRALHEGPGTFVIPNPWDAGSARVLAGLSFQALATSSAASAIALGRRDHGLTRDEAIAHSCLIVGATDWPVSADLGQGFGDAPEAAAETVRLAGGAGLVGCTIEIQRATRTVLCTRSVWLSSGSPPLPNAQSRCSGPCSEGQAGTQPVEGELNWVCYEELSVTAAAGAIVVAA
jgi:hypothetical protein